MSEIWLQADAISTQISKAGLFLFWKYISSGSELLYSNSLLISSSSELLYNNSLLISCSSELLYNNSLFGGWL